MRRAQLLIGVGMVLAFLISGAYMHLALNHLRGMPLALRMVYRASHINMLLIGAFNIASAGRERSAIATARIADGVASVLGMAACGFFAAAFVREPAFPGLYRPWTRLGVYSIFGGAVVQVLILWLSPRNRTR